VTDRPVHARFGRVVRRGNVEGRLGGNLFERPSYKCAMVRICINRTKFRVIIALCPGINCFCIATVSTESSIDNTDFNVLTSVACLMPGKGTKVIGQCRPERDPSATLQGATCSDGQGRMGSAMAMAMAGRREMELQLR